MANCQSGWWIGNEGTARASKSHILQNTKGNTVRIFTTFVTKGQTGFGCASRSAEWRNAVCSQRG